MDYLENFSWFLLLSSVYYWVPPKSVATHRFPLLRMNKSQRIAAFRTSPKPFDSLVVTDRLFCHGIGLFFSFLFIRQCRTTNESWRELLRLLPNVFDKGQTPTIAVATASWKIVKIQSVKGLALNGKLLWINSCLVSSLLYEVLLVAFHIEL